MMAKIFIYTLSTCSHCRRAKEFLNEQGFDFEYIDVDLCEGDQRASTIEEVKKYNPRCTFPTLVIDEDTIIVGFKETELREALGL